jgi:DNA primase
LPSLRDGRQLSFLFLPQGEDPDSVVRAEGKTGIEARIADALPLPDYLLQQLGARCDLSRIDGRARLVEFAKPLLQKIPAGALSELLLGRIAQLARLDRDALDRALPAAGPGKRTPRPAVAGAPKKSMVRLGLSLLLQRPELAGEIADIEELADLELPGVDLLVEVTQMIRRSPNLNSASILERYRQNPHHKHLEKLAVWDHMIPAEDLDRELKAVIDQLRQRLASQRATQLLHKSNLSDDEKAKLRELLSQRPK